MRDSQIMLTLKSVETREQAVEAGRLLIEPLLENGYVYLARALNCMGDWDRGAFSWVKHTAEHGLEHADYDASGAGRHWNGPGALGCPPDPSPEVTEREAGT